MQHRDAGHVGGLAQNVLSQERRTGDRREPLVEELDRHYPLKGSAANANGDIDVLLVEVDGRWAGGNAQAYPRVLLTGSVPSRATSQRVAKAGVTLMESVPAPAA